MISLAAIGSTIANNRAVQYGIGAGMLVLGFLFWLANHDRRLLENERLRAERKARKTQNTIRKENNERLEKAERTRAGFRATDADDFGGLSDAAIERLTRGASRSSAGEG